MEQPVPNYLNPGVPAGLPLYEAPVITATPESLEGYGELVSDPEERPIEIVPWPVPGWRKLDPNTGDEGGTTEGVFDFTWEGDTLRGRNAAVGGDYVLGWAVDPAEAKVGERVELPEQVLLWHLNYHPDGGQLFFPLDGSAFMAPLALPGDDLKPEDIKIFFVEAGKGLYIHPSIWHEGIFPLSPRSRVFDRQGKVHARISCDLAREFGFLLKVPLRAPA